MNLVLVGRSVGRCVTIGVGRLARCLVRCIYNLGTVDTLTLETRLECVLVRTVRTVLYWYMGSDYSHKSRLIEIEVGRYGRYVLTKLVDVVSDTPSPRCSDLCSAGAPTVVG